ncbi:MAG: hypothetical protein MZV70_70010 [Desulfobacterales bacterium]|nr:hypothetical protein [Desulfobacterales bacterium]
MLSIKKPEEETIYWVKRNLEHEEQAYKTLLKFKFQPMQTNNLHLGIDEAIDFFNVVVPMRFLLIAGKWLNLKIYPSLKPLKNRLKYMRKVDFDDSIDSFYFGNSFRGKQN